MDSHIAFTSFAGKRIHIGVCGSIALYKALDLLRDLRDAGLDIGVTLTESAQRFVTPLAFAALGASPVHTRLFSASSDGDDRDPFMHLMPAASARAFAVVAATATTLSRLAHGLADEILSCQALAFPNPLLIAPAMNPKMWANPATQENCEILRRRGHRIIEPACGRVACMDEGQGRLADLRLIYLEILRSVSPQDMAGTTVMVTLGPTREYWDAVRFWSNPSSGVMGASLAVAAWLRGAQVHAVCGPGAFPNQPWLPPGITRHNVTSAKEMFDCASSLWQQSDYGIFSAAVADFSPVQVSSGKFKKSSAANDLHIPFTATQDILGTLAGEKTASQKIMGFAAETDNLESEVLRKLRSKNADMMVGNLVNAPGAGFGSATNTVYIADSSGTASALPTMPKPDLAWRLLDCLLRL